MREVFIKSINQSSLKRVIWISNIKESDEVINLKYLTYIFISSASDYTNTVLHLEEVEEVDAFGGEVGGSRRLRRRLSRPDHTGRRVGRLFKF